MSEKPPDEASLSPLQRAYLKVQEVQGRLAAAEAARREPIAILGMACRLPGSVSSPADYWRLLAEARNAVVEIPPSRWDLAAYFDADPEAAGKMYTRWGGFVDGADQFDPQFFGITPREAVTMDPQQRLLLEVTWEALENAGIPPDRLVGSSTGVFTGIGFNDYARLLAHQDVREVSAYSGSGVQLCFAAGRVSYVLGLRGPSMPIDTACSSSLVALHQAVSSLRARECDLALASGVNLLLAPEGNIFLSRTGALSPTGSCKTFDRDADGFVRSEGCAVLVLRRLSDARRDGQPVLAVIRGSAVNHDGRSSGLTVPSGPAQEAVMRAALANAGLAPDAVSYVEAHGTGTPLGDPIELQSTLAVYGQRAAGDGPMRIGSVKTNFGHAEAASGVASVVKVVLMLQHRQIAPQLHFQSLNPHAQVASAVEVPTRLGPWEPAGERPRIAGVSSFGLSGTNAHVLIEEAPAREEGEVAGGSAPWVLPISARRESALESLVQGHAVGLARAETSLAAWSVAAARGRSHHDHRLAVVAASTEEASALLQARLAGETLPTRGLPKLLVGRRPVAGRPRIAFVFTGQGPQRAGMGLELAATQPVFAAALKACDEAFQPLLGRSLLADLEAPEPASRLASTAVAQPALFVLQVALVALFRSWGIEPDAVVGHSLGEVAAAHVAGALSLADAARVVHQRSLLLDRVTGLGRMVALGLSADAARELIEPWAERVNVAVVNAASSVVVAGDPEAVAAVIEAARSRQVFCRPLPVDYAFHSAQTAPLEVELVAALRGLEPTPSWVPFYSTVTGQAAAGTDLGAGYWGRNLAQPVSFASAVERLIADGVRCFLELSPHPNLRVALTEQLEAQRQAGTVTATLARGEAELACVRVALASLYTAGADVDWDAVYPGSVPSTVLPNYAWQHQRYWIEPRTSAPSAAGGAAGAAAPVSAAGPTDPWLGLPLEPPADRPRSRYWQLELDPDRLERLGVERRNGRLLVPGTALVALGLRAARAALASDRASLSTLEIPNQLVVEDGTSYTLQLAVGAHAEHEPPMFSVHGRAGAGTGAWLLHATARVLQG